MAGAVALNEDIYSHSNYTHMWDEVDAQYCRSGARGVTVSQCVHVCVLVVSQCGVRVCCVWMMPGQYQACVSVSPGARRKIPGVNAAV